jgi:3-hydroxyacyl-CoA dehydrogenase/enoyl-CoA hydratase/3-hydroxybutyryl-CoA epimerase
MQEPAWKYETDATGLATLTLDVPGKSANTLSSAVLEQLSGQLDHIERERPQGLLVRSGKRNGFVAGADINEFTTLRSEAEALLMVRRGQALCDRIAALPCPTVALLQGFALGGGLELALACRYRVGVDDGRLTLGLPEVQLGIHPGFGGTVRAVRLLGVRPAMDLMLTGKTLRADRALSVGLVDRLATPAEALQVCQALLREQPPAHAPALLERMLSWPGVRVLVTPMLLRQVSAKARRDHYPAPYAIIALWAAHGARGRTAYDAEAASIARLFLTSTARNLVRVYQLQEKLKALGAREQIPGETAVRTVHVIGAGVMGGDIAAWCALRGLEVTLQDRSAEQVDPALRRAADLFAKRIRDPAERAAATGRLRSDVGGTGIAGADVVIEAIYENLPAKRDLFARIEPQLKPTALLATNTSSLTLESIATALAVPARLVGLHFFNPVAQMPLVEIVQGEFTGAAVMAAAQTFARRLDRLPLPCRSSPGFLVNRVLAPYLLEALIALEQGLAPEVIDAAAKDYGMPMGPIELADVVGLDVCRHVGEIVGQLSGRAPPLPLTRIDERIAVGKLGRKSGEGFYQWQDGKPQRQKVAASDVPADLQDRLILALVNESRACLREGIVRDADLVDAGLIFGAGFAPFRGGPLAWAAEAGNATIIVRLQQLAAVHGERFTPDAGWFNSQK